MAREALLEGLAALGVAPADLARIVLTHSHSDHCGLARWLSDKACAPVYVHRLERRKLVPGYDYYGERLPFLRQSGLPGEVLEEILEDSDPLEMPVLNGRVEEVQGGEVLGFEGGSLRLLHMPGHAPGHICLHDCEQGNFFSGDFLLKEITPNPVMEVDPTDTSRRLPVLTQYLEGLRLLKTLDLRLIWPGHGQNIENTMEAIARAIRHHERRLEAVLRILEENCWNAYQVMRYFYPKIKGFQVFLGISEILAYLDYLVAGGQVTREDRNGISYYRRT